MTEPIQQPAIEPQPVDELAVLKAENETLRRTNAEIIAKAATRKAKIAELETSVSGLTGKLSEAGDTIKDITIGVPLKAMAESMSTAPELFTEQFCKAFKLEMVKGALTILTNDGKPVVDKAGKAVPFERVALTEFLTSGDSIQAKTFRTITIANRASGAGNSSGKQSKAAQPERPQFGLR